jgi:hypothetical protein
MRRSLLSLALGLSVLTGCTTPRGEPEPPITFVLSDVTTRAATGESATGESSCPWGLAVSIRAAYEDGSASNLSISCTEDGARVDSLWESSWGEGSVDYWEVERENLGDLLALLDELNWTEWEDCTESETWPHLRLAIDDGDRSRSLRCGGKPPPDWRRVIDALLELDDSAEPWHYYADVEPPPRVKIKVYPFESAKIKFVYTGDKEGTMIVWIDDYGDTIVMSSNFPKWIPATRTTIWKDGQTTSWSSGSNTIQQFDARIWNTRLQLVEQRDAAQLEARGYVRKDNETVAGMDCEVWHSERELITLWRWNGIDLKYINTYVSWQKQSIVAKSVALDVEVPADVFEPPAGYGEDEM